MSFPPPTERQARVIWLALTGLAAAALVALGVALIWGLGQVLRMLSPVLWPIAILCVFGLALVIVAAVFGSVVPQLVNETRQLALRTPAYAARVEKRAQ